MFYTLWFEKEITHTFVYNVDVLCVIIYFIYYIIYYTLFSLYFHGFISIIKLI